MQQIAYVRELATWTLFWLTLFLLWFETAPRILARIPQRRR